MAEVLVEFSEPLVVDDGRSYVARVCGGPMDNGLWQGWIEFVPVGGGEVLRSGRETTQPNRADTLYWASGLTHVYLEGSLQRALNPTVVRPARAVEPSHFDGPAEPDIPADRPAESILNPFSVYRKGERLLRDQLGALSSWHLVNIIRDYRLSNSGTLALNAMTQADLIELIVATVKLRKEEPVSR